MKPKCGDPDDCLEKSLSIAKQQGEMMRAGRGFVKHSEMDTEVFPTHTSPLSGLHKWEVRVSALLLLLLLLSWVRFCDPMNCSMPGFSVQSGNQY